MVVGAFVGAAVTGAFVILEKGKHFRLNLQISVLYYLKFILFHLQIHMISILTGKVFAMFNVLF